MDQQDEAILVTGGAGYIGSHVLLALSEASRRVVVVDNLSTGSAEAVPSDIPLIRANVGDRTIVESTIRNYRVGVVMHLAASIDVAESTARPRSYYENNLCESVAFLSACADAGIKKFILSSTAAVYGNPDATPVPESAATKPISPYGASKLMTETVFRDVAAAEGLSLAVLRYFNVAGADPNGRAGPRASSMTHLIAAACDTALGRRKELTIFGDNYPTRDGTCIRDYIHVTDLANAHTALLDRLNNPTVNLLYNCGYGKGHSVREVVAAIERVTKRRLPVLVSDRRAGDAAEVVADARKLAGC